MARFKKSSRFRKKKRVVFRKKAFGKALMRTGRRTAIKFVAKGAEVKHMDFVYAATTAFSTYSLLLLPPADINANGGIE